MGKSLVKQLKAELAFYKKRCERMEFDFNRLQQQLHDFKRNQFGSKSERYADLENPQGLLFDDAQQAVPNNDRDNDESNVVSIAAHKRKKKRSENLSNLPRRDVIVSVSDADRICGCGKDKVLVRYDTSEILNYVPPVYEVIVEKREVVACHKGCNQSIKTASAPKRVIPKVLATASFLSSVIVSKVDDRQPLYHLEKQFEKRYQFYLSRQRLAHYFIETAKALQPLCNLMQDVIIGYDVSSCDATGLQVLQEPGRPATRKSYVYCMRGGSPGQSVVLYDYNALDHKQYIMNWYAGFAGFLHVDADPFFDRFIKSDTVQLSYCNAHARRRFEKITKQTKADGLANHAMRVYRALYKIERKAKNEKQTPAQRYVLRQTESKPMMKELKSWLDEHYNLVLPKSSIGKAIKYCLKHWDGLVRFLDDGRLEIDNNLTEQSIKPFVIARKNFMFAASIAGAKALCIHFSLAQTAKAHGLDPYKYYVKVLASLAGCQTAEDYEQLLPWNIELEAGNLKKAA